MRKTTVLLFLFILSQIATAGISVIPLPDSIKQLDGNDFIFNKNTQIAADANLQSVAKILDEFLSPAFGFHLSLSAEKLTNNVVILKLDNKLDLGEEGYRLKSDSNSIVIEANNPAGIFYGIQTLRQLLPVEIFNKYQIDGVVWKAPSVEIEDRPQFGWRGSHLDVSRHFMPFEFVKKYIDLMAIHKLNRFHWHLLDNQGWRVEIKKYPKLTEIGAWRDRTLISSRKAPNEVYEHKRHGGYYTQEQIRQIVAYAKERFIEVVPEIEMPGHCASAIAAYPQLSCSEEQIFVPYGGRGFDGKGGKYAIYCPGKEEVFTFNEDVLREVMEMFPYKYIHIGGDEVRKTSWMKCPRCQARIKTEGLKDANELQSYFIKRIEKFLVANNKKMIGWDEISQGGLAPEATVMCRFNADFTAGIIKQQHDVIMTNDRYCYFDYYQGDRKTEPVAFGGFLPLAKVYSYIPIPAGLTPEQEKHILGVQACLWTEYVRTPKHAEYMAYPRLCALSEVAWTEAGEKNYDDFLIRLKEHLNRLDKCEVNYRKLDK